MLSQLTDATITNIGGNDWAGEYTYYKNGDMASRTITGTANTTFSYTGNQMAGASDGETDKITKYCYDGDQVVSEYDYNDVSEDYDLARVFIYGPGIDEPVSVFNHIGGVVIYYYHFDGLGSVAALSDVNGVIVERYEYDVFGKATIYDANNDEIIDSNYSNPYMFTGRRIDSETGLYYYRARYYNPAIGRFLQPDPIGYTAGLNLYTYCGNSPINWIDPSGLGTLSISVTGTGSFGASVMGNWGVIIDSRGNVGLQSVIGGGGGSPAASGVLSIAATTAESIYHTQDIANQTGGSAFVAGFDYIVGDSYSGGEFNVGPTISPAYGVEVHSHIAHTTITHSVNVVDVAKAAGRGIARGARAIGRSVSSFFGGGGGLGGPDGNGGGGLGGPDGNGGGGLGGPDGNGGGGLGGPDGNGGGGLDGPDGSGGGGGSCGKKGC